MIESVNRFQFFVVSTLNMILSLSVTVEVGSSVITHTQTEAPSIILNSTSRVVKLEAQC